jgi:hypothetical protein
MKVIYNKWEKWIDTKGKEIKIGDGSRKTFKSVMGTWYVTAVTAEQKVMGKRREIVGTDRTGGVGV